MDLVLSNGQLTGFRITRQDKPVKAIKPDFLIECPFEKPMANSSKHHAPSTVYP